MFDVDISLHGFVDGDGRVVRDFVSSCMVRTPLKAKECFLVGGHAMPNHHVWINLNGQRQVWVQGGTTAPLLRDVEDSRNLHPSYGDIVFHTEDR